MIKSLRKLSPYSKLWLTSRFFYSWYFTWPIVVLYFSTHYSLQLLGVYFSVQALVSILGEIPTGIFADKFGRKLSITLGYILRSLGVVMVIFGLSPAGIVIAGILRGIGAAFLSGATEALIYEKVTHKEYEHISALDVTVYQAGLLFSVFMGGFMYTNNPQLPFIVEGLGGVLSLVPLLLIPHLKGIEEKFSLRGGLSSLKRILTTRTAIIFSASIAIYSFIQDIFLDILLEKRLIELYVTPSGRGLIISLTKVSVLIVFQTFLISRLSTMRSKVWFAMVSGLIGFIGIGLTNTPLLFILLYFVLNLFTILRGAIQNPIIQKLASPSSRATDSSMYSLIQTLPFLVGAILVTRYLSGHNSRLIYVGFGLVLGLIALPLLLRSVAWYEKN